jgi:hypothetical protein
VFVPSHPLVGHWLAVARNKLSPPPIFRSAVAELGRVLIYEATSDWLPTVSGQVETPCGLAECTFVDPQQPIKVCPLTDFRITKRTRVREREREREREERDGEREVGEDRLTMDTVNWAG